MHWTGHGVSLSECRSEPYGMTQLTQTRPNGLWSVEDNDEATNVGQLGPKYQLLWMYSTGELEIRTDKRESVCVCV